MDGSLELLSKDHKDTVSPSLRLLFVGYCLRYAECSSQLSQKNREGQKFFQLNHLHINTITIWKSTERKKYATSIQRRKENELVQSFKYLLNYCNTDFYYQYHRYNV